MPFAITYKASAERELAGLSHRLRRRVRRQVQKLLPDPRRPIDVEAEEMVWGDWEGYSPLVVGEYRVIYEIDDRAERVSILRVAHRSDVYEGSPGSLA